MKRKIGDLTLAEIKRICAKMEDCLYCPFGRKIQRDGYSVSDPDPCILDKMLDYPYAMDVDKEIEIEEEKNDEHREILN